MAQPFSFGFSGDDIEEDPNDVSNTTIANPGTTENGPPPIEAQTHDLDELVGKTFYTVYLSLSHSIYILFL